MAANKKGKKASKAKTKAKDTDAPQIIVATGGLSAVDFAKEVNFTLDEPLSNKQLKDLRDSIQAVVVDQLEQGNPVNLFGLVKIVPRLHTKGTRMVNSVFGDSESPKVKKNYKAKVSLKATQGIFSKPVKDALPSAQKLQTKLGSKPKAAGRKKK